MATTFTLVWWFIFVSFNGLAFYCLSRTLICLFRAPSKKIDSLMHAPLRAEILDTVYYSDIYKSTSAAIILSISFTTLFILLQEYAGFSRIHEYYQEFCGPDAILMVILFGAELAIFLIFVIIIWYSGLQSYLAMIWGLNRRAITPRDVASAARRDIGSRISSLWKLAQMTVLSQDDWELWENESEKLRSYDLDLKDFLQEELTLHMHSISRNACLNDAELYSLQDGCSHVFSPDLIRVIRAFDNSVLQGFGVVFVTLSVSWCALVLEANNVRTYLFPIGTLMYVLAPVLASVIFFEAPSMHVYPLFPCIPRCTCFASCDSDTEDSINLNLHPNFDALAKFDIDNLDSVSDHWCGIDSSSDVIGGSPELSMAVVKQPSLQISRTLNGYRYSDRTGSVYQLKNDETAQSEDENIAGVTQHTKRDVSLRGPIIE